MKSHSNKILNKLYMVYCTYWFYWLWMHHIKYHFWQSRIIQEILVFIWQKNWYDSDDGFIIITIFIICFKVDIPFKFYVMFFYCLHFCIYVYININLKTDMIYQQNIHIKCRGLLRCFLIWKHIIPEGGWRQQEYVADKEICT